MNCYRHFKYIVYLVLYLQVSCTTNHNFLMNRSIELNENWTFQMEGDSIIYQAKVPGTVQTDLLLNSKIPQPFYRDNEKKYQWIDKENWIYTTSFNLDSSDFLSSEVYLNFKGLDTYASVKLNNIPILEANNFFRSWRVKVKKHLKSGTNHLEIKFISPIKIGLEKLEELGYPLPAVNDQSEVGGLGENKVSVFTRKAPYHYGWDWGPRFVTMGIWRPVVLEFCSGAEIRNVFFQQETITGYLADITAQIDLQCYTEGSYTLKIRDQTTNNIYVEQEVKYNQGIYNTEINFKIQNPKLWWPNGYGDQNLYAFNVDLLDNGKLIHSKTVRVGLRDIKLIRKDDDKGQSFYFQVNGVPVFAKGANYIPNDNFLPQVSQEKYKHIVKSAFDAHMNMLRVWGGGIYENDIFYDLCDEYGILVWQDFMYACSMYPGNDEFLENARVEATENVIKLRNHPSIALWCGNNEMDAAWCEWDENCGWGWKELYNAEQKKQIWNAYDTLFHKILPDIVRTYSPSTSYWPSSPVADWGKSASYSNKSGDMHYWGVWHGGDPFEKFEDFVPRFMSEYGFQSFPEFNTINEFTLPQDWNIYSDVMLAHQRSSIGNQKIREYMGLYYKVPDDFKDMLYVGQVLQAYGIGKAIDIHRINKPFCMGSLYWQLNDCWPGASWSSIDYFGNWKALHYKAKEAFSSTRLATLQNDDKLKIFVLNDELNREKGVLQIDILDFQGENLYQNQQPVQFDFDSSSLVAHLNISEIPEEIDLKKSVLIARLFEDDQLVSEIKHYFVLPKDLVLPQSAIQYKINEQSDAYQIILKSTCLEKDVSISIPEVSAVYSDNYFDLLPNQTKTIHVQFTRIENNVLNKQIVIQTLNDINNRY